MLVDKYFTGLALDRKNTKPVYIQLYEQLRNSIEDGIIREDSKLPAIRYLADKLAVNSVTVVNAYKLLEDNKLVYKRMGSGTYVMPLKEKIITEVDANSAVDEMDYGVEGDYDQDIINFASASPDPQLFPLNDFKRVVNEVLERDGGVAFTYQDSLGYKPLRYAISDHMQLNGINASAEDVNIISGAQQGIDIISKVLLSNGDYVFVESPTYMGAVSAFRARGAKIVEIPLKNDGMDMNELEKRLKLIRPKFIYVMPNFQNPTGCSYSERKKKHLLLLCKKYGVLIVEDDYLSDLSFISAAAVPLKAYDSDNRVIYIKSFSKIFMPGLRIAYLIIPQFIREKVANAKYMADISTSGFMQRVLDSYFRSGIWNKHIEYMKKEYSIRYYEAVRASRKLLPGASFNPPNGGLNLWIRLPEEINCGELLAKCSDNKVIFMPGTAFLNSEEGNRYFRLSFAAVKPDKIAEGISIISRLMDSLRNKSIR